MMAKATDSRQEGATAKPAADFSRVEIAGLGEGGNVYPLMSNPAAAFAAATAIGFGFSSQMAGAFFGALQGAVEASHKFAASLEKTMPEAGAHDTASEPAPVAETMVETQVVARPVKPVVVKARKTSVVAKTRPAKTVAAAPAPKADAAAKPARAKVRADDLKRISGIGPKLETVLNGMGVHRIADIAAWTDADVKTIDDALDFDGRIGRDDWVGQAKALSRGKSAKA